MAKTKSVAKNNYELFTRYRDVRRDWITNHVDEAINFYFGSQWTEDERETLKERGQADIVVNRVRAIIRAMVAQYTSNKPTFRAVPVTGGDRQVANIFNEIFSYIWRISSGYKQFERAIFNYARAGVGYWLVYYDPMADWGQGEVKLRQVRIDEVYIDPSAGDEPDWGDAQAMIISKRIPLEKAAELYPHIRKSSLRKAVMAAEAEDSDMEQENKILLGPEEVAEEDIELEMVRIIEAYRKKIKKFWLTFDKTTGQTTIEEKTPEDDPNKQSAPVLIPYIERSVTAGYDVFIAQEDLPPPIEDYPLIPVVYEDTENTQPLGEVEFLKGPQQLLNKALSVTILSAQVGSTPKVLLWEGSVNNQQDFEDSYAAPGSVNTIRDTGSGPPIIVSPMPLNNAFFSIMQEMKKDMEYESGVFGPMQGDPTDAPATARATLALQEYGASKSKLSLRSVEFSLTRLGKSTMQFVQAYWRLPKVLRLVTDETEEEQVIAVNQPQFDNQGQEIRKFNDVTVGRYDMVVTAGSTLPTNRMALLGLHMDLVEKGVPLKYALKYLDVPDAEKIIKETDQLAQQAQQLEQMQQGMEQMQNELQKEKTKVATADRAVRDAQYEANLSKALNQHRAAMEVEQSRNRESLRSQINEMASDLKDQIRDTLSEVQKQLTPAPEREE